jgi:DNA-binding CsgD family transcriptional regulator
VGRWDDALAELDVGFGLSKHPFAECCDRGVAATIRLHRGDPLARESLARGRECAADSKRVSGALTLATCLELEQADRPGEALAALHDGLNALSAEVDEAIVLFPDAVRLAVRLGDGVAARTLVEQAEEAAAASDVPHRQAIRAHCRGLLDADPALLRRAAELYATSGRPLPRAQALEAAGLALAETGEVADARTYFTEAFTTYTQLGAAWDLARTQAIFRTFGIRRGPRVKHRHADRGWDSLTPTELKIVDLVARGMSNPEIAVHLFLSRRTVQTHVSHVLAKLNLHSRIDIAREASRRDAASH